MHVITVWFILPMNDVILEFYVFSHPQNDIDDEVTPGASPTGVSPTGASHTGVSPTGASPTEDKEQDKPEEQNTDNKEGEDDDEDM